MSVRPWPVCRAQASGATTPAKVASGHMDDAPDTQSLASAPEVIAPDGSVVRPLCRIAGLGSFAATMPPWPVHGEHRVRPERGPWTSALRRPHEE
jgi:hypothetical protein